MARGGAAQLVRVGEQAPVERGAALQLLVRTDVGELALLQDGDPVGEAEGGAAVGDQQGRAARHHLRQGLVDLVLDAGVDGRGGVVEEKQPGVGEDRAGERDALPLAAGEGQAVLADLGVVAEGQIGDETVRLGGAGGLLDLVLGGVRVSVRDIGADRVGEEEAVFRYEADGGPQRVLGELADVVAADQDGALRHVVEAGQQQGDGGLPAAGGTDDGDGLTGLDGQREPVEDRPLGVVPEPHVVELDARGGVRRELHRAVLHGGLGVDQFEYALDTGAGLLPDGEHHGEHPDRPDELGEIGGERHERTEGDLAAGGEPAAERQHRDLAERGDGLESGGVPGVQPDGAQPPGEQLPPYLAQLAGLLLLLPEPLDDPDPGDGPVDDSGDCGGLALGVPGGGEEPGAGAAGDEPEGGGDGDRHQGQQRGEPRHDDQGDEEEQHVPDGHREHEQKPLDQLKVAGGAPDDLPGGQLVLPLPVEPGERPVHLGTQIVLDVEGKPAAVVTADVRRYVHQHGRGDQEAGPDSEGAGVVADDIVDDHLGDQRDERQHGHPGERRAECQQHIAPVAPCVAAQPPGPAPPLRVRACVRHRCLPFDLIYRKAPTRSAADFIPPSQRWSVRPTPRIRTREELRLRCGRHHRHRRSLGHRRNRFLRLHAAGRSSSARWRPGSGPCGWPGRPPGWC